MTGPAEAHNETPAALLPGCLYLVGTPIGNLSDLSPRARDVLASVDLIAAEDTRRTRPLLTRFGISGPLISYHEHNRREREDRLIQALKDGQTVALVSDAGMPAISDPGEDLVRACVEEGLPVAVVPGPCAAIAGLSGSGLDTSRFAFEGFLPASGRDRKAALTRVVSEGRTVVLYEAPHRLMRTLGDLEAAGAGLRLLACGRELTKRHEEFIRGTVTVLKSGFEATPPRGEFVLVLEGAEACRTRCGDDAVPENAVPEGPWEPDRVRTRAAELLETGLSVRAAARQLASESGIPRNEAYTRMLEARDAP